MRPVTKEEMIAHVIMRFEEGSLTKEQAQTIIDALGVPFQWIN